MSYSPTDGRVIDVKRVYGLKGDTKQLAGVTTTSGSAVITDTGANFTAADVGKTIRVEATTPVVTTIASVQSATQCTLAATIGSSQTLRTAFYGTDDTAKIQQALNDHGFTAAYAGGPVTLYFSEGCYMIAGALQDTSTYNSQLKIPFTATVNAAGAQPWNLRLLGAGRVEGYFLSGSPMPTMTGTIFYSPLQGSGTLPSIFRAAPRGVTGSDANFMHLEIDGITFRTGNGSIMVACSAQEVSTCRIGWERGVTCDVGVPSNQYAPSASSWGLTTPDTNNGACTQIGSLMVTGYRNGVLAKEHFDAKNLMIQSCIIGLYVDNAFSGAGSHTAHVDKMLTQWCVSSIYVGTAGYLHVDHYSSEHATSGTFNFAFDVEDAASNAIIQLDTFHIIVAGVGAQDSAFKVSGAGNVWAMPLQTQGRVPTKTGNYTLNNGDWRVLFNGTGLTATLPDPTTAIGGGRTYEVKNLNASSLTVVSAGTSKTIDGAASVTVPQWGVLRCMRQHPGGQWITF